MVTLAFGIISFVYILLVSIIYFSKKRLKNLENSIYVRILFLTLIGEVINISAGILYLNGMTDNLIYNVLAKLLFIYFIVWDMHLLMYTYVISDSKVKQERMITYNILTILLGIISWFMPFETKQIGDNVYSTGPIMIFFAVVTIILVMSIIAVIFKERKMLKNKRTIPLLIFIFLGIVMYAVQTVTNLTLMICVFDFVAVLMYFTIENPDMLLLDEVHRSKEISDAANEEKTIFLYNMTQEIRNTTNDINMNADMILESDSLDDDKDCAREIKGITSKFNSMTNELFDVSKLDTANIKVYNSKYKVKNILKEVVTMYGNTCKKNNIDFRVSIDRNVPDILYGDSIGLKEVLTIIMDNSIKYTKDGFIEFAVNTIIKNDVCRLVITIEDSGVGIKSDDINKIKLENKSLSKANNLITLMNGAMIISSNYGIGTKIKLILDQKMEIITNEEISKYDDIYDDVKLLMVDDSDSGIKIIDKLIKGSNIKMDFAMNGKECLEKIRTEKYDIILLDEQLSHIKASELIKKIKDIKNFDVPVILLTKDNSYEYNDEYQKLGFSDYILKPVKKTELLNIINKHTKKDK